MESLNHTLIHYTVDEPKFPTSLKTAKELSESLKGALDVDRILGLASSGFLPHWIVDDGPFLFQLQEVKEWIRVNLLKRTEGRDYPIKLRVLVEPKPPKSPPSSIALFRNLGEIPFAESPPGVYFLVKDDVVIYVGQSVNCYTRIQSHQDKNFDTAFMIPVPPELLDRVEGSLIRVMRPKLNGQSVNGKMCAPCSDIEMSDADIINGYKNRIEDTSVKTQIQPDE